MENADDIRKSSQMFQLCLNDKKKVRGTGSRPILQAADCRLCEADLPRPPACCQSAQSPACGENSDSVRSADSQFCADVPPGHSRAMDCLEAHRMEPDFSEPCRNIIEASVAERSADFRLDASLRAACKKDIQRRCRRPHIFFGHVRMKLPTQPTNVAYACWPPKLDSCTFCSSSSSSNCQQALKEAVHNSVQLKAWSCVHRCAVDQDIVLDPVQSEEGLVINCLQDYRCALFSNTF